jgi:hypothetical protein
VPVFPLTQVAAALVANLVGGGSATTQSEKLMQVEEAGSGEQTASYTRCQTTLPLK